MMGNSELNEVLTEVMVVCSGYNYNICMADMIKSHYMSVAQIRMEPNASGI
jgi:hypothetical protein